MRPVVTFAVAAVGARLTVPPSSFATAAETAVTTAATAQPCRLPPKSQVCLQVGRTTGVVDETPVVASASAVASASDPSVRRRLHVGDAARVSEVSPSLTRSAAALASVVVAVERVASAYADAERRVALSARGGTSDKRQTKVVVCGVEQAEAQAHRASPAVETLTLVGAAKRVAVDGA